MKKYLVRKVRSGHYKNTWYAKRPNTAVLGQFTSWDLAMAAVNAELAKAGR
jgi:hypothetical protein